MTFFVVGSGGYLGRLLSESLIGRWPIQRVSSSERQPGVMKLDLLAPDEFDYESVAAGDFVAFTAGISSPDICATQCAMAHAVNVKGTTWAIERFLARGARVVFFSSDVVFGHRAEEVMEEEPVHPFGPYAEMKSETERRFRGEARVKALRLSYVTSGNDKFTKYLSACASGDQVAKVFGDLYRRAVAACDVVEGIDALCMGWDEFASPALNAAGPDLLSRVEVAQLFNEVAGSHLRIDVVEPPEGFRSARPGTVNMGSRYFETLLGRRPTSIREAFRLALRPGAGALPG